VFLNQLETQPHDDISKNDLDIGEQEEGMGQPEINIPMAKLSANIDPSPTSPLEHTGNSPAKELREPTMEHLYMGGSLGNNLP
jgi:hypothetical protein